MDASQPSNAPSGSFRLRLKDVRASISVKDLTVLMRKRKRRKVAVSAIGGELTALENGVHWCLCVFCVCMLKKEGGACVYKVCSFDVCSVLY